ncbi:MAG: TetR/AcrR family transcriptional regulator [Solirubrobacteraceae bacterium]
MSNLGERPARADARRNVERILEVTIELIATDPGASMERVAAAAGVSRATLYHHFHRRDALMDTLTDQSIGEVTAALAAARPAEGSAPEAMERVLRAAWQVIGRYRGLVIVNQRLERAELRARLAPALAPVHALIQRGQRDGAFDPELPAEWLLSTVIDLIHAASRQVTGGAMDPGSAERALLRTAAAALASHRQ